MYWPNMTRELSDIVQMREYLLGTYECSSIEKWECITEQNPNDPNRVPYAVFSYEKPLSSSICMNPSGHKLGLSSSM